MINILIADDSATETLLLKHIFEAEKDMRVIGCAENGKQAFELAATLKPDLITMDIQMPIMSGLEAIQLIMMNNPIPIVVISSTLDNTHLNTTFNALEAGAVSVIDKPINVQHPSFTFASKRIVSLIRSMAGLNVVKKRFVSRSNQKPMEPLVSPKFTNPHYEVLGIGASVGGPQALNAILSKLPANFPIPIVVVQHMTLGFLDGFCNWLNASCPLLVKCAEQDELLRPGVVYFAPENQHLEIKRCGLYLVAHLKKSPPVAGFCPSITVLLQSIAKTCGKNAAGMLLTGMGNDGAEGLLELKQKNGHTIIQDAKSSVVFGMASVAQSLGAVDVTVTLDNMVHYITHLTQRASS